MAAPFLDDVMEIFDTHCHLDDVKFADDLEDVLQRMQDMAVQYCLCPGSDLASSRRCVNLAQQYDFMYAAAGVHPHEAKDAAVDYLDQLAELLKMPKVQALGEIGLDYYYDLSPRDVQRKVRDEQVNLALKMDKPVIFHIRDAHGEMVDYLRGLSKRPRGIIHCFSGSVEVAREYVRMGYYISFAGPLTFKKAPNLWEAAKVVPLERLLVETDSPYLSPEPKRGRRNEPGHTRYVLEKLAQLWDMSAEEMAVITTKNAMEIYDIA